MKTYYEEDKYLRARKRVEDIKGFYGNLVAYLIVIPLLVWINYNHTSHFPWVIFPIVGWGIGLICHGLDAFGYSPFLGRNWEERKIREYMQDDKF